MDAEGMGEVDWNELQNNLEATIPVYDRINRFATVGQVSRWRRMVASRLPEEGKILEIENTSRLIEKPKHSYTKTLFKISRFMNKKNTIISP